MDVESHIARDSQDQTCNRTFILLALAPCAVLPCFKLFVYRWVPSRCADSMWPLTRPQVLPIEWSALPLSMMVVVCGIQWLWFYKIVRMATGTEQEPGKDKTQWSSTIHFSWRTPDELRHSLTKTCMLLLACIHVANCTRLILLLPAANGSTMMKGFKPW